MTTWILPSVPPHDWTLCLDVDSYFDLEHDPLTLPETGFTRPVPLEERDVILTIHFNEDPEKPEFAIRCDEELSSDEIAQANRSLSRILGTDLDLRPFYDQAARDQVLGPAMSELYGLKRMSRATLFEEALNRIIQMRLSHKPTAKKMVYSLRERYGTLLMARDQPLPSWPRPFQLAGADPLQIRKLGPTLRKGEYVTGLAAEILAGEIDMEWLDRHATPSQFYETITRVRGIGPSLAQDLMLTRPRTDALFPSQLSKGMETGMRKWIIMRYGGDPQRTDEKRFASMTEAWKGYEAAGAEFLFVEWLLEEKAERERRKQ